MTVDDFWDHVLSGEPGGFIKVAIGFAIIMIGGGILAVGIGTAIRLVPSSPTPSQWVCPTCHRAIETGDKP